MKRQRKGKRTNMRRCTMSNQGVESLAAAYFTGDKIGPTIGLFRAHEDFFNLENKITDDTVFNVYDMNEDDKVMCSYIYGQVKNILKKDIDREYKAMMRDFKEMARG